MMQSLVSITSKKAAMAAISILVLLTSTIVLVGFLIAPHFESHEAPLPGVPIQDTIFAGLVSDEADAVFLPAGSIVSTSDSVKMTVKGEVNEPPISKGEAEQIGIDFFHQFPYMANVTLIPDAFWNELRDNPFYSLRYFVGQYGFYAAVNAMTGRVISVSPHWSVLLQYNTSVESSELSEQELEEKAYSFLEYNNYTLSSHARVEHPTLEKDAIVHNFPAYSLKIFCVVDGCLVRGSILSMLLSAGSGVVIGFTYQWRNITNIPVGNAVSAIQAEREARAYLNEKLNVSEFSITSSSLQFYIVDSYPDFSYQLCWVVDISHELYVRLIIDAIDLEILEVWIYGLA